MKERTSDELLLSSVKDSREEAFRVLFDRYQPIVFRHTLIQTRETDLAHDIVQETFLRVWEHRHRLKPERSFLAYALRISTNIVRNTIRNRKTRLRLEQEIPRPTLSEGDDPHQLLQISVLEEKLILVLNDLLPDRCRTVFLLSRVEGKKNLEIAELLGISVRTVEHQINHALKVLRREMREYV